MSEIEGHQAASPGAEPERKERSPAVKFLFVLLIGFLLAIPLFASWLLIYDRQSQNDTARQSIVAGWGGEQVFAGPRLVIPYSAQVTETVEQNGRSVTRTNTVERELFLAPQTAKLETALDTKVKGRSIYEVVVYETEIAGQARFALPADLDRYGVAADALRFDRAELRFGVSDARGLSGNNRVTFAGEPLNLQPGKGLGETGNSGFFAFVDAGALSDGAIATEFRIRFKGNESVSISPHAGRTDWTVTSPWPHPSFTGSFLPESSEVTDAGFRATYTVTNLALGTSLVTTQPGRQVYPSSEPRGSMEMAYVEPGMAGPSAIATVSLIQPVDLYDQVSRATKYGFLFIGFTFVAFLLFDLIGGARVSAVQYILVGVALILFFVLLLAFAEIIGFAAAYAIASVAVVAQVTAYAASVLRDWRRAAVIGALLAALYAVIYVLLSLEAYSLLIGALLIFAALAGVMYVTRRLDWTATLVRRPAEPA